MNDGNDEMEDMMGCDRDGFPVCVPKELKRAYVNKGVTRLFDWQMQCLSDRELYSPNFANLVYTAPTGGGKTMIAEIVAICNVLKTGRRAIFAFPFISNAKEKLVFLQHIWRSVNKKLKGFIGGDSHGLHRWNGAVCTYEKAAGLLNQFIEADELRQIGVVVVDELHMVFEGDRGGVVENLINKILYINATGRGSKIQVIGMSATLPEYQLMADWIQARTFVSDFRPVELREFALIDQVVYALENTELTKERELGKQFLITNDHKYEGFLGIVMEAVVDEKSVIVFCSTKAEVEQSAKLVMNCIQAYLSRANDEGCRFPELARIFSETIQKQAAEYFTTKTSCNDVNLITCIVNGVCWHHAGLTVEEREQIEYLFHQGTVRVLCATSTLSSGESYILCKHEEWPAIAKQIEKRVHPRPVRRMTRMILEAICSELVTTTEELRLLLDECVFSQPMSSIEIDVATLNENQVISTDDASGGLKPTQLGRAILGSTLDMSSAKQIYKDLENGMKSLCIDTEIHMLFLVTPIKSSLEARNIDWNFYHALFCKLGEPEARVASRVGVTMNFIMKRLAGDQSFGDLLNVHIRFFIAMILHDMINEVPLDKVSQKFKLNRGVLQSLQQSTSSYAFMICAFCDRLGWSYLKSLLEEFAERLQFGIRRDLTELVRVPEIDAVRARAFHAGGIKSLKKLSDATVDEIKKILRKAVPFATHPNADHSKNTWLFGRGMMDDVTAADILKDAALDAIQERIEHTIGLPTMMQKLIDDEVEKSFLSNHWQTDDDSIFHRSQLDELCDSMSPLAIKDILNEPSPTRDESATPVHVGMKKARERLGRHTTESVDSETHSPAAKRPHLSSPKKKSPQKASPKKKDEQAERSETFYSEGDRPLKLLSICGCNKEKLSSLRECGMSLVGKRAGEVVICYGEHSFSLIELNGKCSTCDENGVELLASILVEDGVRKWFPDELEFIRGAPLRTHFVQKSQVPTNLGCVQTLITLAGDDCSKKIPLQEFAKKYELPEWVKKMMRTLNAPRIDAILDAYLALRLSRRLLSTASTRNKLQRIYLDSVEVVARTEIHGFALNKKKSAKMVEFLVNEMAKEEREIHKLAGEKFNLDSPKEISNVLFKKMQLEVPKHASSTKTHLSTKSDVLKRMEHPIAAKIMKWRTLEHALATLRSLDDYVDPLDGRIRTIFDSNNVQTGRISSTDPNLHSLGKEPVAGNNSMRSVMVAAEGNVLLDADYSQLELRILCEMTKDPTLLTLFNSDSKDVFQDMTAYFKNGATRAKTKQLSYALIYGMGAERLSSELNITKEEAHSLIDQFFEAFPRVKMWMDQKGEEGKKDKVVESYLGRKRALSDEKGGSKAPRQGVNHIVQATAAELFRKALVDVEKAIKEFSGMIVNQIHDEIIVEVPKEKANKCAKAVKQAMEAVFDDEFQVKFPVRVQIGMSWGNTEDI